MAVDTRCLLPQVGYTEGGKEAGGMEQSSGGLNREAMGRRADQAWERGVFGGSRAYQILTPFPGLICFHRSMCTCAGSITGGGPSLSMGPAGAYIMGWYKYSFFLRRPVAFKSPPPPATGCR